MPIRFSEEYNIEQPVIKQIGVFDVIMDIDTRVFIDPALLELCTEEEFTEAKEKVEQYFSNVITLLRNSEKTNDMYWKGADRLLSFSEIKGTCFGYSARNTNGNAIGKALRKRILYVIKDLIEKGEKDPVLFELLGVFQENIGCDRISDLITFILYEDILKYTDRVLETCNIPTNVKITCNKKIYNTCLNKYNNENLLLLPSCVLSPLPIAESFDDIDFICQENQRVREVVNSYFDLGNKTKITKGQIRQMMYANEEFRQALIDVYKSMPKQEYDFTSDPIGEYIWCPISKEYTHKYPLNIDDTEIFNITDVEEITLKICEQFKRLIEHNGLYRLLYNDDGKPKHESAAQLLFFGIADGYCTANDLDLSRESNAGRGPVDFKMSKGAKEKVVVEVKLTSNPQLKHGIEKQLPIYAVQEKVKKAIYLVIDNGHNKTLENFIKFYNDLESTVKENVKCIIIDGTFKTSASKS